MAPRIGAWTERQKEANLKTKHKWGGFYVSQPVQTGEPMVFYRHCTACGRIERRTALSDWVPVRPTEPLGCDEPKAEGKKEDE